MCEIALERERWKTGGNDKKKKEKRERKAKVNSKLQNLCKNLGTKDLDSLVVLETC